VDLKMFLKMDLPGTMQSNLSVYQLRLQTAVAISSTLTINNRLYWSRMPSSRAFILILIRLWISSIIC